MIRAEMRVIAGEARRDKILHTFKWLAGQLEADPGLEETGLYRSLDREDEVVLVQQWKTREDLVRYVRSDEFVRLLEVLDLSETPPEIYFDTVSERQGLELVEALRTEKAAKQTE